MLKYKLYLNPSGQMLSQLFTVCQGAPPAELVYIYISKECSPERGVLWSKTNFAENPASIGLGKGCYFFANI